MNRRPDFECESELDPSGRRLGGSFRLAVYRSLSTSTVSNGDATTTKEPTLSPTLKPTVSPTLAPVLSPTRTPTRNPTRDPTENSGGSVVGALSYVGCFENFGANRVSGHVNDLSISQCEDRSIGEYFGMEWPQGYHTPGNAQCLSLSGVPSMNRV